MTTWCRVHVPFTFLNSSLLEEQSTTHSNKTIDSIVQFIQDICPLRHTNKLSKYFAKRNKFTSRCSGYPISFGWCFSMCPFSRHLYAKDFVHSVQANGFSNVWIRIWVLSVKLVWKLLLHSLQEYLRSPEWTKKCLCRARLKMLHLEFTSSGRFTVSRLDNPNPCICRSLSQSAWNSGFEPFNRW